MTKPSLMKKLRKAAGITLLSTALSIPATNSQAGSNDDMYRTAGINIALNGVISGIGSKLHGHGFWQGFKKGSLAGSIMYAGKYAMYNYAGKPVLPLAGKAIHALGTSVRDNSYFGEPSLSTYRIDLGPVSLTYHKDNRAFSYKLLPSSIVGIAYSVSEHARLDIGNTINTATLVFHTDDANKIGNGHSGITAGTTIVLNKEGVKNIFGHELIHAAQNAELGLVDRILGNKLKGKKNWFKSVDDRVELGRYITETTLWPVSENNYEKSFLELEAYRGYSKSN